MAESENNLFQLVVNNGQTILIFVQVIQITDNYLLLTHISKIHDQGLYLYGLNGTALCLHHKYISSVSISTLLVNWHIIWVQSGAQGAEGLYLVTQSIIVWGVTVSSPIPYKNQAHLFSMHCYLNSSTRLMLG